jgi:hypothetical protein
MTYKFPVRTLKAVIVCYLAISFFIFFITWLTLLFSIPLCLILGFCLVKYIQRLSKDDYLEIPVFQAIISTIIVFCWVGVSGNGGMGVQWNDIIKPVAISRDIVLNGNPILYQEASTGETFFLCQYMVFYITIPTLFGFLPWSVVMFISFLYVFFGVMLGMVWFWHLSGSYSPFVTLFFVFFCGIDFAGFAYSVGLKNAILGLKNDFFSYQAFWGNTMIDPKMPFLYQSHTHSMFWSPQHALASWIGMGMFAYDFINKKNLTESPFYLALLIFLSPFIVIGIAPFFLYSAIKKGILGFFTLQNILMIPIVLTIVWYMSSLPIATIESGFIFYKAERLLYYFNQIKAFAIFWLADIGVWMIPVVFFYWKLKNDDFKTLALLTIIVLSLVPLYRFGTYNDWSQRVSMPALFLTSILVVRVFIQSKLKLRLYFVLIFCLAAWDPVYFIGNSLKVTHGKLAFNPYEINAIPTYYEACKKGRFPLNQTVAPVSASFYQIACRKK